MPDRIETCIELLPQPRNLELFKAKWQNDLLWQAFEFPGDAGVMCRVWAACEADARALVKQLSLPKRGELEAYEALFAVDGVAVQAWGEAGFRCFESIATQVRQLAQEEDGVPCCRISDWPDMEIRGIHLDLKYFMHRVDYLTNEWLPELRRSRINTLLLEYEDKFPFQRYPELTAGDAFTPEELRLFLAKARELGMRVVPLFQTLGHWEFILRHERFRDLRGGEAGEYWTEVRPNDPAALALIFELMDEILAYHEDDEWFHAGGDEPWYLRKQYRSRPEMLASTYGRHMKQVCEYLVAKGKRPLIYDDTFRNVSEEGMRKMLSNFPSQTILCFWDYASSLKWPCPASRESVRLYRDLGFDVLGLPCHNWGSLVPFYNDHTVRNTVDMIQFASEAGAIGVINTTWACFRVPLPLSSFGIALTGARTWRVTCDPVLSDVERAFCRHWHGVKDVRVLQGIYLLGIQLEFPCDLGRPLNLPHYYYMDAVVQLGSHEMREKLGSSLDLYANADHRLIVGRKLQMVRNSPKYQNAVEALVRLRAQAQAAQALLDSIEDEVTLGLPAFRWVQWVAKFKQYAARRMLRLLGEGGAEPEELLVEGEDLKAAFRLCAQPFLTPCEISMELGYLFEGEEAFIGDAIEIAPV